jgi:Domain of unknown function (DUF5679)
MPILHLPHAVIVKAPGLLPMWYKPGELAEELGVPDRTLRGWLEAGAPHRRDEQGHLWVNGHAFAAWVRAVRQARQVRRLTKHSSPLAPDEAYCMRCRRPVPLVNPARREQGKRVLLTGTCPVCGGGVSRGGRIG